MIIVADATPIIAFARIGRLDILKLAYGTIIVPNGVYRELVASGHTQPSTSEIEGADWILVEKVENPIAVRLLLERLDQGESEAIVLALEKDASLLLMDEAKGRRIAKAHGLTITGTIGILQAAKNRKIIERVRPILDELIADGFRVGTDLYKRTLIASSEEE